MSTYERFAEVYDLFMDNVPYDRWAENIRELLLSYRISDGLVLDLCCGTGELTRRLAAFGYDMIGVDASLEMLSVAREKGGESILYLAQEMDRFELYGTVRAIVSTFDSLNYAASEEELFKVFSLANNYLDPGGLLLFDLNTEYKYRELLTNDTSAENRGEGSLICETYYDEETKVNESVLTFYVREEDGRFSRFSEVHEQRAFSTDTIKKLLTDAGLSLRAIYDISKQDFDPDAPMEAASEDARRLLFVAQEVRKEQ